MRLTHKILASLTLALALNTAQASQPLPSDDVIVRTLTQAGLITPIKAIAPSPINSLLTITLDGGQEPLLLTHNLQYIIQGQISPNPSPKVAIDPNVISQGVAGTPISNAHKNALLANMTALKNISNDNVFYHTNIDGLLWSVSAGGMPFLVSADGRYFIDGEISVIKDGQFAGLDDDFESTKNRHVFGQFDQSTLTIYPAKGKERATVYIATDINCPYCKIFHSKINEFNQKGITIKAIGYPVYDESHTPMQGIWCESDNTKRAGLLASAMKGVVSKKYCKNNNLYYNQQTANALAITATPAIFNEQGELFLGDFSGAEFLEFLNIQ